MGVLTIAHWRFFDGSAFVSVTSQHYCAQATQRRCWPIRFP